MVDPILTLVDPNLPLKSDVEVIDPVPCLVDPTLSLKSEEQVVRPTLPLEIEVKVVESRSYPIDPTLLSKSVKIEVVAPTQSLSCPYLPVESGLKFAEVFIVSSDCSMQEEFFSLSTEPSLSSEVISFDKSNIIESRLHSSVPL